MRTIRLYIPQNLPKDQLIKLDHETSHRLTRVLRLNDQTALEVFNGDGYNYQSTLHISGKHASISVHHSSENVTESSLPITLVQAISKGDRMDFVMQKATELGVHQIQPVFSQFGEVKLKADRLEKKVLHWQKITISAAEQSGRSYVPKVLNPVTLDSLNINPTESTHLVLSPRATIALQSIPQPSACHLYIGPEGGFSDQEVDFLQQQSCHPISLGPRILRTETAALSALSVTQLLWGDLGIVQ